MVHLPKGQRQNNTEGIASATTHCDGMGGQKLSYLAYSICLLTASCHDSPVFLPCNVVGFSERKVPTVSRTPIYMKNGTVILAEIIPRVRLWMSS